MPSKTTASAKTPARAWQRMLSGRRLDLADPSPVDIEIGDIAHGLARVARWNGQTIGDHAFSVAQHSCFVLDIVDRLNPAASPVQRQMALLHDAPEYVVGDLISPFKAIVGTRYKALEERLLRAIHLRFGLPADTPETWKKAIKRADTIAAYFEATELAGFGSAEARRIFGNPRGYVLSAGGLVPLPAADAQRLFLDVFERIEQARAKTG
ncbi:MAG: HD family hydrolase [Salaquimonas sp.]|nr:HD family hydrolase [Salaquimonas sp.]